MQDEYPEACCATCNWYLYHKTSECRECVHPDSVYYGDWTGPRNFCPEWVGKRRPATINRGFDAAIDAMIRQLKVTNEKCKEINEQVRQATAKYWESEVTDMEDKAAITKALLPVLKMTRDHADLVSLEYSQTKHRETVTAGYKNHYRVAIDVTADSGIALIIDVIDVITQLHHRRLKWGDKGGAEYGA